MLRRCDKKIAESIATPIRGPMKGADCPRLALVLQVPRNLGAAAARQARVLLASGQEKNSWGCPARRLEMR